MGLGFRAAPRKGTMVMTDEVESFGDLPQFRQQSGERTQAPTMGQVAKINYSHTDMIDFIIANPGTTQNAIAARYGYSVGWVSNVMASDAWQSAMAARRSEICDPVLVATIEERFKGITLLSLERLKQKLEAPQVSDNVVLKAVELGAKAIGVGGNAPAPQHQGDHLAMLANRLIELQSKVRIATNVEVIDV
jgi:hypothetical protein